MPQHTSETKALADQAKILYPDACEWNPATGMPAYDYQVHASAEFIVGANGKWRLCASCASLPEFNRYRVRTPVVRAGRERLMRITEPTKQSIVDDLEGE